MNRLRQLLAALSLATLLAGTTAFLGSAPVGANGPARGECLAQFNQEAGNFVVRVTNKKGEAYFYVTNRPPKNCVQV
jgi:hypothetical protein